MTYIHGEKPKQPTPPALAPVTGSAARTQEELLRIELYNAAVSYVNYIAGDTSDFHEAMRVAQRLEDAADSFANR